MRAYYNEIKYDISEFYYRVKQITFTKQFLENENDDESFVKNKSTST